MGKLQIPSWRWYGICGMGSIGSVNQPVAAWVSSKTGEPAARKGVS